MTREEAIRILASSRIPGSKQTEALETLIPELAESESEEEKIIDTLIWLVEGRKKNRTTAYGDVKIDDILSWLKKQKECFADSSKISASEDERTRKEIIEYLWDISNQTPVVKESLDCRRWITWLEKQKYDRMKPIYDARESFESALEKAWKDYNDSGARTVDGCEDDYVECAHAKGFREGYLFGFERRKEQEPAGEPIRKKIIGKAKSGKQVVLVSETNGDAEIDWDTRSLEDTGNLLERGLAFINEKLGRKPAEWSEDKYPKDIETDAVQFCFDKGFNITPHQAKEIATHYLMIGHNEGYVEGRKNAHIPAKELGLPSSMDFKQEWSEEDETKLRDVVRLVEDSGHVKSIREHYKKFLTSLPERFNLRPEQWSEEDIKKIRSEEYTKGFNDAAFGGKLKEWSEEDSDNLERVDNYLWVLDDYVGDDCAMPQGKTDKIRGNIQGILSPWLKSLPERFNLQPKQDWSGEDEEMFFFINELLENKGRDYFTTLVYDAVQNWLKNRFKSLRPQPQKELSIEKAIQWLDDTFYFLDNSSGRGIDYEITTHDFDSLEEMYDSFRKAVTVDSQSSWKASEEDRNTLLMAATVLKANFDSDEKFEDCDYDCETLAEKLLEMRYRISPSWKPSETEVRKACDHNTGEKIPENGGWIITPHKEFFKWIYERLIHVHKENPNVDYMRSLKERIDNMPPDEPQWKPTDSHLRFLRAVVNDPKNAGAESCHIALKSLLEELEKL